MAHMRRMMVVATLLAAAFAVACSAGERASSPIQSPDELTRRSEDLHGLQVFPPDNPWNTDISGLPVHSNSANFVKFVGEDKPLHPEFGEPWMGGPSGIPYVLVKGDAPKVSIVSWKYPDASDAGPYPIPENPPIEGGTNATGDRHLLMVDTDNKVLYELFSLRKTERGWTAGSGAIFDLTSNKLRPLGWTSADAAGLPIFPGLVRYDEVIGRGEITHAIRVTVRRTQRSFILPATHHAGLTNDPNAPPMGLRFRLKADYDISGFPEQVQVILTALKKYGMLVADNGGDWFITGAPDPRWDDDILRTLQRVKGRDFEAVDTGPVHTEMGPGQAGQGRVRVDATSSVRGAPGR